MFYAKKMKLLFWRRKTIIYLEIKIDDEKSQLSTGIPSNSGQWKGSKLKFVGYSGAILNESLDKIERNVYSIRDCLIGIGAKATPEQIAKIYRDFQDKKIPLTYENLSTLLIRTKTENHLTVIEVIDWAYNYKKSVEKIKDPTLKTYTRRKNNLVKFLSEVCKVNMFAADFTIEIITLFADWCLQRFGKNYTVRHILYFQESFALAKARGIIPVNNISDYRLKKEVRKDLRRLNLSQVSALEDLNLEGRLSVVRDLFVFCVYTGFHYCDRNSLEPSNLIYRGNVAWIIKPRQKTSIMAKIKLHPKAMRIINKYGGVDKLPKIDNTTNNLLLKVLEAMIGIKIGLSTKIARKTFAYLSLNHWGFDIESTAAMMGLASTAHIKDYAEVTEERIDKMVRWDKILPDQNIQICAN